MAELVWKDDSLYIQRGERSDFVGDVSEVAFQPGIFEVKVRGKRVATQTSKEGARQRLWNEGLEKIAKSKKK